MKVLLELCHGHLLDFQDGKSPRCDKSGKRYNRSLLHGGSWRHLMEFEQTYHMTGTTSYVFCLCSFWPLLREDSKGGKLSPKEMMEPFVQITEAVRT